MQFDVIIGNPPYQMSDGGNGASAKPLYHLFVERSIKLNPRYLTMIIPARWYAGGKGLDDFRNSMFEDKHMRVLEDYFDSTECFPGVDLSGGVCFFLWDRDNQGKCTVTNHKQKKTTTQTRLLLDEIAKTFIRFNEATGIVQKIVKKGGASFEIKVSSRKPFGMETKTKVSKTKIPGGIFTFAYPDNGYVERNMITKNPQWINEYKVLEAKAYGERGDFPYLVLGKPFISEPYTCCTETYIVIGPWKSKEECESVMSYIKTKFFRFLVLLKKNTQDATSKVYSLVPLQDFSHPWTDEMLYEKYGLTEDEIAFIESMIRPME
jgi:site-specific DNA-methyltransferase (adenine-specific)